MGSAAQLGADYLNGISNPEGEYGGVQEFSENIAPTVAGIATETVLNAIKVPDVVAKPIAISVDAALTVTEKVGDAAQASQCVNQDNCR